MNVPENLLYTKEHEWLMVKGDIGVIGITHFAQEQLGDVVFVELPPANSNIIQGNSFGVVESVKTVSDLYSPVSGSVLEVNLNLNETPEDVNTHPYGDGWIIQISISDKQELGQLLNSEDYQQLIGKKYIKYAIKKESKN